MNSPTLGKGVQVKKESETDHRQRREDDDELSPTLNAVSGAPVVPILSTSSTFVPRENGCRVPRTSNLRRHQKTHINRSNPVRTFGHPESNLARSGRNAILDDDDGDLHYRGWVEKNNRTGNFDDAVCLSCFLVSIFTDLIMQHIEQLLRTPNLNSHHLFVQ